MRLVFVLLGLLGVVATIVPIVREQAWWIRIFDFPRLQVAGVCGMAIIIHGYSMARGRPGLSYQFLAILTALSLLYQVYRIFPYTPFASKQVQSARGEVRHPNMGLLIANVQMSNRAAGSLRQLIQESDPDIILVAEPDAWWEEQLRTLETRYPFSIKHPLDNTYGMLLYSRLELKESQVRYLVENDVPSIHTRVRLTPDLWVRIHFLHPKPPYPGESKDTEKRDAELVLVAKEMQKEPGPTIVAGDLNDVAWSHTTRLFQRISRALDPRVGRGMFNTFHADWPLVRFPLDHIFHSDHFELIRLQRKPNIGSDHFPIFAHVSYRRAAKGEQEAPPPRPGDMREAEKKIKEVQ